MIKKICHITSVHYRYDTRIFHKECISLSNHGYDVTLIVNDNKPDEILNGVKIISINFKHANRLQRIISSRKYVLEKAIEVDADIYHFHDPELLPVGALLQKRRKKVIYDSHEHVCDQILAKRWIPSFLRKPISVAFGIYETNVSKGLSAIIVPTPYIKKRFSKVNKNVYQVCNFPLLREFESIAKSDKVGNYCCYIGGISIDRGARQIVEATRKASIELILAGKFETEELKNEILAESKYLKYLGVINRNEVSQVMQNSVLGFVILLATPNNIEGYPNKMFEYMAAGIPVISSNFEVWKQVIEGEQCGICVNPNDVDAIADAIKYIVNNHDKAKTMGGNGRQAILNKYNWNTQEKILLELYGIL